MTMPLKHLFSLYIVKGTLKEPNIIFRNAGQFFIEYPAYVLFDPH